MEGGAIEKNTRFSPREPVRKLFFFFFVSKISCKVGISRNLIFTVSPHGAGRDGGPNFIDASLAFSELDRLDTDKVGFPFWKHDDVRRRQLLLRRGFYL